MLRQDLTKTSDGFNMFYDFKWSKSKTAKVQKTFKICISDVNLKIHVWSWLCLKHFEYAAANVSWSIVPKHKLRQRTMLRGRDTSNKLFFFSDLLLWSLILYTMLIVIQLTMELYLTLDILTPSCMGYEVSL